MELSFQWLISNLVVIISHLDLLVPNHLHEPSLPVLDHLAPLFEQPDPEVTPDLHIIRLRHLRVHIVRHNQVLHDLKLNQVPSGLRAQRHSRGDAVTVAGVKFIQVEERGLLRGVQMDQN